MNDLHPYVWLEAKRAHFYGSKQVSTKGETVVKPGGSLSWNKYNANNHFQHPTLHRVRPQGCPLQPMPLLTCLGDQCGGNAPDGSVFPSDSAENQIVQFELKQRFDAGMNDDGGTDDGTSSGGTSSATLEPDTAVETTEQVRSTDGG